jgi:selenocysteine lyase/cysteine desulfurase
VASVAARAALPTAAQRGAPAAVLAARRVRPSNEGRRWMEMQSASTSTTNTYSIKGEAIEGVSSFLDNQSTTAMDPRVLDSMMPLLTWQYGNPHSRSHHYGWEAESKVEDARASVGEMIGADAKEIIFTSGATESNNMSIKGVARFYKAKKKHIITTQVVPHGTATPRCSTTRQRTDSNPGWYVF